MFSKRFCSLRTISPSVFLYPSIHLSIHQSMVKKQEAQIVAASADIKALAVRKLQKLWWLLLATLYSQKCSLCLLPNAQVSAAAATIRAWPCCLGIVHTVYDIVRCMSLEHLPPSMSQRWLQDFKIKAQSVCKHIITKI